MVKKISTAYVQEWRKRMKSTTLVIMAAGMGSRYGGLKQIDPVDPESSS